jgi:polygalacturonase
LIDSRRTPHQGYSDTNMTWRPLRVFLLSALAASASCHGNRPAADPTTDADAAEGEGGLPPEPHIPSACVTLQAQKTATDQIVGAADEQNLDTDRIQKAIDGCPAGQAVKLAKSGSKNAFVSGPLVMRSGVSLWVDGGATLFASRDPRDFDKESGSNTCGTEANDDSGGCKPLILIKKASDVGIVGEGVIDGRGGEPMIGSELTWWDVAQAAKVKKVKHSTPRLIDVKDAENFTLYKIKLHNSPKFHVVINSAGYTVWGVEVLTPSRKTNSVGKALSPFYARNTDGIDPSSATNGAIVYCNISTGDDQIAVKATDSGPIENLIIAHNHFGAGHGMSIGSETNGGVSKVRVSDLTIDGDVDSGGMPKSDLNGIRIKSDLSKGGLVTDITYRDICIRDMQNPILLSPHYSDAQGSLVPQYTKLLFNDVFMVKGSHPEVEPVITLQGFDAQHMLSATFDHVTIDWTPTIKAEFANLETGPGEVNFTVNGEHVQVTKKTGNAGKGNACAQKFAESPYK